MDGEMMMMKKMIKKMKTRGGPGQNLHLDPDQGHILLALHDHPAPQDLQALQGQDLGQDLDQGREPDVATPGLGQGNIDSGQRSPRSLSV